MTVKWSDTFPDTHNKGHQHATTYEGALDGLEQVANDLEAENQGSAVTAAVASIRELVRQGRGHVGTVREHLNNTNAHYQRHVLDPDAAGGRNLTI